MCLCSTDMPLLKEAWKMQQSFGLPVLASETLLLVLHSCQNRRGSLWRCGFLGSVPRSVPKEARERDSRLHTCFASCFWEEFLHNMVYVQRPELASFFKCQKRKEQPAPAGVGLTRLKRFSWMGKTCKSIICMCLGCCYFSRGTLAKLHEVQVVYILSQVMHTLLFSTFFFFFFQIIVSIVNHYSHCCRCYCTVRGCFSLLLCFSSDRGQTF